MRLRSLELPSGMFPHQESKSMATKEITKPIEQENWYISLIDDCQGILTEGIWNYRLTLIKTYHLLGKRILEENDNFKREKIYGEKICQHVGISFPHKSSPS